jgi:hypothetical protein
MDSGFLLKLPAPSIGRRAGDEGSVGGRGQSIPPHPQRRKGFATFFSCWSGASCAQICSAGSGRTAVRRYSSWPSNRLDRIPGDHQLSELLGGPVDMALASRQRNREVPRQVRVEFDAGHFDRARRIVLYRAIRDILRDDRSTVEHQVAGDQVLLRIPFDQERNMACAMPGGFVCGDAQAPN